ncbi:MAG TPA: TetR/AcrR family transcriptional regulator C-terminal domain-containing protein [Caulobacteraceae bacterium]|nr:TetR/AcrR family transcriptional regulator C-terminal domain-containing protein [Caulobacteraceae bacterium]
MAAATVLDRDGYDRLTMRAVAAEIGVQAPALYWHVKSKEDLSLLLFDHLIDNLDYGAPTGDWRGDIRRMAQRLRARLVGTRDIIRLFPENYTGPRANRSLELMLGLLRQAGVPAAEALHVYGAALAFVVGWARFEVTRRAIQKRHPVIAPPLPEMQPNLAWAVAAAGMDPAYDEGFRYGVDLLMAGLEQRLAEVSAQTAPN